MQKRKLLELTEGWVNGDDNAYHIRFHPYPKMKGVELDDMPSLPVLVALDDEHVLINSGAEYLPRTKFGRANLNAIHRALGSTRTKSMELPSRPGFDAYSGLTRHANVVWSWKRQFWRDYFKMVQVKAKYSVLYKSWIRPVFIVTTAIIVSRYV